MLIVLSTVTKYTSDLKRKNHQQQRVQTRSFFFEKCPTRKGNFHTSFGRMEISSALVFSPMLVVFPLRKTQQQWRGEPGVGPFGVASRAKFDEVKF